MQGLPVRILKYSRLPGYLPEHTMNKTFLSVVATLMLLASALFASPPYVDVQPGSVKSTVTQAGYSWMPGGFGGPNQLYAVFRLGPLAAGKAYALTLTYDAGTDIGYGHSWVDGDPAGKDYASLVGIGSGTGTRELKGKEDKFLFTVNPKSTSNLLYLLVRTSQAWNLSVGLADRPSGLSRDSQDRWGYYYVTDFDFDRTSPFLLTRSAGAPPVAEAQASPSGYMELPPNTTRPLATAKSFPAMPNFFGGPDAHYAVVHMGPLAAGRRYELTLTFDAGDNVGYSAAWSTGTPWARTTGPSWASARRRVPGDEEQAAEVPLQHRREEQLRLDVPARALQPALEPVRGPDRPAHPGADHELPGPLGLLLRDGFRPGPQFPVPARPQQALSAAGAPAQEQPVVAPQVRHFRQVPLRTRVRWPHTVQGSPS